MEQTSGGLTEVLANLNLGWILAIVAGLTFGRLALVRSSSPVARSVAEFLESGLIAVVLVFLIIRPFVVQAYFIPSPSMEPTLLGKNGSGDRILVNKFEYRYRNPKHDDVVVFIPPKEATDGSPQEAGGAPVNFIKRLIGEPGDRLQAVSGKVIISGRIYNHAKVRSALFEAGVFGNNTDGYDELQDLQADHHVKFVKDGVLADGTLVPKTRLAEILTSMPNADVQVQPGYTILNGQRLNEPFTAEDPDYDLKIFQGEPLKFDASGAKLDGQSISLAEYNHDNSFPTEQIPPHHYFMMGDNRNDSKDSTEWGPLEGSRVVGHAQFIFWPLGRMRTIR